MGLHIRTPAQWRRLGMTVGHERGQLDRYAGITDLPANLWIPDGCPDAFTEGLKEGWREGNSGRAPALDL